MKLGSNNADHVHKIPVIQLIQKTVFITLKFISYFGKLDQNLSEYLNNEMKCCQAVAISIIQLKAVPAIVTATPPTTLKSNQNLTDRK